MLLVDDTIEYLTPMKRLIRRDGHEVLTATSGREALDILRRCRVDLVLVDYFMPGMTGEEMVTELRTFDTDVQVILQTGYASENPPRELLRRLDIQGYHDKSEGPEKLLLWVDVGLKAAATLQLMQRSRLGLRYILNATPELHRMQPLDELLQGVLLQATGLIGAVDAFLADLPRPIGNQDIEAFVAMSHADHGLRIRAATGRFTGDERVVPPALIEDLTQALSQGKVAHFDAGTVAPLRVGASTIGAIFVDRPVIDDRDLELIEVFANQAAVAIHNATLFEMAALDTLTGVYTRRFFEQALQREIRLAQRNGVPVSLLMIDLDDMKQINDIGGHLCGDAALEAAGTLLRQSTRATDVVGRFGGDEFAVILPGADASGARIVAQRVRDAFAELSVPAPNGPMPVRASVGSACLSPEEDLAGPAAGGAVEERMSRLIRCADESLYRRKRAIKRDPRYRDAKAATT